VLKKKPRVVKNNPETTKLPQKILAEVKDWKSRALEEQSFITGEASRLMETFYKKYLKHHKMALFVGPPAGDDTPGVASSRRNAMGKVDITGIKMLGE
jgi:hypothetical protein